MTSEILQGQRPPADLYHMIRRFKLVSEAEAEGLLHSIAKLKVQTSQAHYQKISFLLSVGDEYAKPLIENWLGLRVQARKALLRHVIPGLLLVETNKPRTIEAEELQAAVMCIVFYSRGMIHHFEAKGDLQKTLRDFFARCWSNKELREVLGYTDEQMVEALVWTENHDVLLTRPIHGAAVVIHEILVAGLGYRLPLNQFALEMSDGSSLQDLKSMLVMAGCASKIGPSHYLGRIGNTQLLLLGRQERMSLLCEA